MKLFIIFILLISGGLFAGIAAYTAIEKIGINAQPIDYFIIAIVSFIALGILREIE
jgi:hypothetical protein